jgi:glyceraldehyde 3-phosphate dehydrogenase
MIRVAINGFGRIGRTFYRLAHDRDEIQVVAVNDLMDLKTLTYLLKYDTAYGVQDYEVSFDDDSFSVDGHTIKYYSERNPADLPWAENDIDVVVESTGFFTEYQKAAAHLKAGAGHVVISAPAKGDPVENIGGATALVGLNDEEILSNNKISSNASCTTNAGGSVIKVLNDSIGIEKAMLNTVHAYTSTQNLVDSPHKKLRRGRAAAHNIVPTTTGAAIATTKVITDLEGKFDGVALRVPVIVGSIADITFIASRDTSVDEVNEILENASRQSHWAGIFAVTREPLVSSDIVGRTEASIVDLGMTRVVDGNLVKVLAWYDNETSYTGTLLEHVLRAGRKI